jgi:hypothetical protein
MDIFAVAKNMQSSSDDPNIRVLANVLTKE